MKLRHAVIQDVSDWEVKLSDVFFKEDLTHQMQAPTSVEVTNACFIDVSMLCYDVY